jgi:hypothetical protein
MHLKLRRRTRFRRVLLAASDLQSYCKCLIAGPLYKRDTRSDHGPKLAADVHP